MELTVISLVCRWDGYIVLRSLPCSTFKGPLSSCVSRGKVPHNPPDQTEIHRGNNQTVRVLDALLDADIDLCHAIFRQASSKHRVQRMNPSTTTMLSASRQISACRAKAGATPSNCGIAPVLFHQAPQAVLHTFHLMPPGFIIKLPSGKTGACPSPTIKSSRETDTAWIPYLFQNLNQAVRSRFFPLLLGPESITIGIAHGVPQSHIGGGGKIFGIRFFNFRIILRGQLRAASLICSKWLTYFR